MAIGNDNNDKKNEAPRGGQHRPRPSFFDFNPNHFRDMDAPFPELSKFQSLLNDVLAQANPGFEFALLPVTDEKLAAPALVMVTWLRDAKEKGVGYHTVLIETSETDLPPRFVPWQGGQHEVQPTLGDVYDRIYVQTVNGLVRKQHPDVPVFDGGGRALYRSTNIDDPATLHRLAADMAQAASNQLLVDTGELREICLTEIDNGARHVVNFDYASKTIKDVLGQPVRRDVGITLVMQAPRTQMAQPARDLHLGDVGGFVDLIPLPNHRYLPRFVITQLEAGRHMTNMLSMQMLMLAMATCLTENDGWYDALVSPNMEIERHERLEALLGKPIEEADSDFIANKKAELFQPGLVFSLDVGSASADTWRTDVWAAAAHGQQPAMEVLYHTAAQLTGGHIERYLQRGTAIVVSENNPIPLGSYVDQYGMKRDLRDIDQLWVMAKFMKTDPRLADEWRDTYMRMEIPPEVRLAKRKQLLRSILGNRVEFTDTATRVTFTSEFIRALQEGVRDTGFSVRVPSKPDNRAPDYPFGSTTIVGGARRSGMFQGGNSFGGMPPQDNRWR